MTTKDKIVILPKRVDKTVQKGTRKAAKIKTFEKGDLLLKPSLEIEKVYFLRKGLVRQYSLSEDGEEVTIHLFKPGSLFPIMLLFSQKPNRYYFEAFTSIEVQELSSESSFDSIVKNKDLLLEFTQKFALAIAGLSQRIEILGSRRVSTKILLFIDYLGKNFGNELPGGKVGIDLNLTHDEIASWVGARRETVSRKIEKLSRQQLISLAKGKIVIEDKRRFDQELEKFVL